MSRPIRLFLRHARALGIAVPIAAYLTVEIRDMYQRGQWDEPHTPSHIDDGDILLISNRWWAMATWKQKAASLITKLLLKTTWDDVGVLLLDPQTHEPYVMTADAERVWYEPLNDFLGRRDPRGAAVRRIRRASDAMEAPPSDLAKAAFIDSMLRRPVKPLKVIRASVDLGNTRLHYNWALDVSQQAATVRRAKANQSSEEMVKAETERFHEKLSMERAIAAKQGEPVEPEWVCSSSLVAATLQFLGYLPRPFPLSIRYAPTDFSTGKIPLVNHVPTDERPIIIFKT